MNEMQSMSISDASNSRKFLDASLARKLEVLEKELYEIQMEVEQRTLLHNTLINEVARKIMAREAEIQDLGGWNVESIYEKRISLLEKEISDFRREKRIEGLNYWRDISRLKEGMRSVLKEIWLIQGKKEFLGKYLEKLNNLEW